MTSCLRNSASISANRSVSCSSWASTGPVPRRIYARCWEHCTPAASSSSNATLQMLSRRTSYCVEHRRQLRPRCFAALTWKAAVVDRFRDVVAPIPSVADVAATGSLKLFRKQGKLIGRQLRALGFNTDFAPCVDLRLEESKSVLGSRTVSADPRETVRYAREFLDGLRDAGILGCGKHFPGLGGATLDSHHALPSIAKTWKQLWSRRPRSLSRDAPRITHGNGRSRLVSKRHRRQHPSVDIEKVDYRHLAPENWISRFGCLR